KRMVLASSPKLSPNLPAKAAECTKWESRTADGLTRKGRRSAGRMVSGQYTPFLNTIWRHVGIEGDCATLSGGLGEGRFAITRRSGCTSFAEAMRGEHGDMGNGRA